MIGDTSETVTHLWAPLVALLAGFVSFASPCVLPLVPGYLSFVTGEAVTDEGRGRWHRLAPTLLFVAGFTVMFTLYGAFASTFVHLVKDRRGQIVAGVVIVVLGVLLIGYALGRGSIRLYAVRRPGARRDLGPRRRRELAMGRLPVALLLARARHPVHRAGARGRVAHRLRPLGAAPLPGDRYRLGVAPSLGGRAGGDGGVHPSVGAADQVRATAVMSGLRS